jgi:tetratricopeptide (TPR) repeat protein
MRRFLIAVTVMALPAIAPVHARAWQQDGPIKPSDKSSGQSSDGGSGQSSGQSSGRSSNQASDKKDQKSSDSKPDSDKPSDDSSSSSSSASGAADELQQADQQPKYDPLPAEKDVEVGMFYLHKGDTDAAIARFQDAIEQKFDYARPRLLLAQIYEKKHDNVNAAKYYKEYLRAYPHAPDAKKIQDKIDKLMAH